MTRWAVPLLGPWSLRSRLEGSHEAGGERPSPAAVGLPRPGGPGDWAAREAEGVEARGGPAMSDLVLIVPIVLIFLATSCFFGICWAVARWRSGPPFTHHSYRLPPNGSPLTDAEAAAFADLKTRFWSKDNK